MQLVKICLYKEKNCTNENIAQRSFSEQHPSVDRQLVDMI
jgi:hypothetical protein